jgi:hypothetical protein
MNNATQNSSALWTVKSLYVCSADEDCTSLAAAKDAVRRRGFSAVICYEGRALMYWCPISGWKTAQS